MNMATNKFLSGCVLQDYLLLHGESTIRQMAKYFETNPWVIHKRMKNLIGYRSVEKKRIPNKHGKLAYHFYLTSNSLNYLKTHNLEKFSSMDNPLFIKSIERMHKVNELLSEKYPDYVPKIIVGVD